MLQQKLWYSICCCCRCHRWYAKITCSKHTKHDNCARIRIRIWKYNFPLCDSLVIAVFLSHFSLFSLCFFPMFIIAFCDSDFHYTFFEFSAFHVIPFICSIFSKMNWSSFFNEVIMRIRNDCVCFSVDERVDICVHSFKSIIFIRKWTNNALEILIHSCLEQIVV